MARFGFFWREPPHTFPDIVFVPVLTVSGEVGSFLIRLRLKPDYCVTCVQPQSSKKK